MLKFYWKLRTAYGHARGLFALDAGRLDRAEQLLRDGINFGERVLSPLLGETYLLLAATVEARGRRDEAAELFWTGIAEVKQSTRYSADDVNYLGAYFCELLELAESRNQFEPVHITAVRKSLRRDFPMSLGKAQLIS